MSSRNTLLLWLVIALTSVAVDGIICFKGICDHVQKPEELKCKGSVIKNGGFCKCFDVCAKVEGEICEASPIRDRSSLGKCDIGLLCQHQDNMIIGEGKCVNAAEVKTVRNTLTLCEQRRVQAMITMVVYRGKWTPKCDAEGLFMPEQCDNTGACFCVDVHTGVVDTSTKVHGSADCAGNEHTTPVIIV